MTKKIRVTEAKVQLSALRARIDYMRGERFVIEHRGRALAALVGVRGEAK